MRLLLILCFFIAAGPVRAEPGESIHFYYPDGTPAKASAGDELRAIGSRVSLLLADLVSETAREQPNLYWFASGSVQQVEHILYEGEKQILREIVRDIGPAGGLFHISLANQGVRLRHGVTYRWVAVLPPEGRGREATRMSGEIRRVPPPAALTQTPADQLPQVLARAGLWCDLLDDLGQRISSGDAPRWRAARAHVLRQVGLDDAARADEALYPLKVELAGVKSAWKAGEKIGLKISGNKRFQAVLVFVAADGRRTQILPAASGPKRNVFEGLVEHIYPGPGDSPLVMAPPLGNGKIVLRATVETNNGAAETIEKSIDLVRRAY